MCEHCSAHDIDVAAPRGPYVNIGDVPDAGDWILDNDDLRLVVAFARYAMSPEQLLDELLTAGWQPHHARELALRLTRERESVVPAGTP